MVTKAAALLLTLFALAAASTLASAQAGAPVPDQPGGTTLPPGSSVPPQGGDEAAQRTIFGSTHRVTVVLGAVLVVLALGLFVAGVRRGPRAADPAARDRGEPVRRGRNDRAA